MMNTLTKTFENADIRLTKINNEVWWNLKDVCASLGMGSQVHKTVKRALTPDQIQSVAFCNQLDGKNYKMLVVNQPGLLKFIWRSNKPNALVFTNWCAEVIDEIMQTGRYDVREHQEQIQRLQRDLSRTQDQLAASLAEVERRVFLVVKDAVAEWRRENGYRNTDFKWRNKHFGGCCNRLLGTLYKNGDTPFVHAEYMENAKQAIKDFYGFCQRNSQTETPLMTQQTITNHFERVETVNQGRL
jgi:prophage antirepressor-like protein